MIEMQYNFPLLPELATQWRDRLREAVDGLDTGNFDELRPTFRSDQSRLRDVAAAWLNAPPERTWITAGNHHASLVAMLASGIAGKPIAFDAVSYVGAMAQARMLGSPLVGCGFDTEGMTAESLREQCVRAVGAGHPIAAVYTMPTVHNPLGCTAGLERRKAIVAVAREFDLLLIEDAAYEYMVPNAPASYAVLAPEHTFYVRGMSKSYAPATRTGFLVAPEQFAGAVNTAMTNTTTGTSLIDNVAAISLIADGTLTRVMAKKCVEGARRNAAARAVLGAWAAPGAEAAWHLWLVLPEHVSLDEVIQGITERDVIVSSGVGFEVVPGAGHGIRVALGGEVDAERTQEGARRIAEALEAFQH